MQTSELVLYSSMVDPWRDNEDFSLYDQNIISFRDYCILSVCESIKTDKFKSVYLCLIDDILSFDIKTRITFAKNIMNSIYSKYDIKLCNNIDILSDKEVRDVLDLVNFIEDNCVESFSFLCEQFISNDIINNEKQVMQCIYNNKVNILKKLLLNNSNPILFQNICNCLTLDSLYSFFLAIFTNKYHNIIVNIKKKKLLRQIKED